MALLILYLGDISKGIKTFCFLFVIFSGLMFLFVYCKTLSYSYKERVILFNKKIAKSFYRFWFYALLIALFMPSQEFLYSIAKEIAKNY